MRERLRRSTSEPGGVSATLPTGEGSQEREQLQQFCFLG